MTKLTISDISQYTRNDINKYDLVIAFDESNYNDLKSLGTKNLVKLGNYAFHGEDVPDPYFFHRFKEFEKVFSTIESYVKNLLESEI